MVCVEWPWDLVFHGVVTETGKGIQLPVSCAPRSVGSETAQSRVNGYPELWDRLLVRGAGLARGLLLPRSMESMRTKALVWEHHAEAWHRYGGPMQTGDALALAFLIRHDDAHDAKVFELEVTGDVADMDSHAFAALRVKTWVVIRGQRVYIMRRLNSEAVLVFDEALSAYRTVVCPSRHDVLCGDRNVH